MNKTSAEKRSGTRIGVRPLATAAIGALLLALHGCAALQRTLIYHPRPYKPAFLAAVRDSLIEISYETAEGRQSSFYDPPRNEGDGGPETLWIVCGGNGSLALDWLGFVRRHPDPHAGFLLFDYPGYGACEGKPSRKTIGQSLDAAVRRLTETLDLADGELEERIALLGHSLGAAVALERAARHGAKRIVLVSPFTSMEGMAQRVVGRPLNKIVVDKFENAAKLKEIAARDSRPPVAIIHGERDRIVPVRMGRRLAEMFPDWIAYQEIPRGDHNYILETAGREIHAAMMGE